jgi:hypothetical protein
MLREKVSGLVDLLRKSGEFPMKDEELHDAEETIHE